MNSLGTSLRLFAVKAWYVVALAVAILVNPVRALQLIHAMPAAYVLPVPFWAYQAFFVVFALVAAFIWFHRQRIAYEAIRPAEPRMMLTDAMRYLARQSQWASRDAGDDLWVTRMRREALDALSLGRVTAYGRKFAPSGEREHALSAIPAEFWRAADLSAFEVMNERSTQQPVHSNQANGPAYTEVYFDPGHLKRAWPPRSWLAGLLRRSPAERRGNVRDWRERDTKLTADERRIAEANKAARS